MVPPNPSQSLRARPAKAAATSAEIMVMATALLLILGILYFDIFVCFTHDALLVKRSLRMTDVENFTAVLFL